MINTSSAHGIVGSRYTSAYVAANPGLHGLTKAIALEPAERDVTVNAICPSYVRTPLVESASEVAAPAALLCSDAAAGSPGRSK